MTGADMPSTALVPADNMAALEALDPQVRELAVTRWLSKAQVSLAHALETSDPARIANFKAEAATVVEATKQLDLSTEIQLDAVEMVRRAERGLGLAIREGQAEGTIRTRLDNLRHGSSPEPGNAGFGKASPTDFAKTDALTAKGDGLYVFADGVSEEQFEEALTEAKSEENLSRANVVRKIKGENGGAGRRQRADLIADLAKHGYSSRQMPKRVGVTEETVRLIARDFNIDIPADKIIGRTRRLDHTRMVEATVNALDDFVSAIDHIDFAEVDPRDAAKWATSLNDSIRALNRFHKTIKEMGTT
jgi:hypothetical protein